MIRLVFGALLAFGLGSTGALGQAPQPKIFVASTGNDSNDGGRATPKRSFQAAHDAVAAGGEIVALDTAGYGPVTITKSVGIVVPPGVNGFVTVTSSTNANGITINAGATDTVTLRGLIVESSGPGNGIYILSAGNVVVEDTTVRDFQIGIFAKMNTNLRLLVHGGAVRGSGYGVLAQDSYTNQTLDAQLWGVEMTADPTSIFVSRQNTGSALRLLVTDSVVRGGVTAFGAANSGAEIVVENCSITGNNMVFSATNTGVIYTRGNNTIYNNASLGTAPTPYSAQ